VRARDGRLVLVAAGADGAPLAYGDLEGDGHIDHLYCRPDAAGTGVTAALYQALEAAARARGIARLYSEASEPARRFFQKQGFAVISRNDFEIGQDRIPDKSASWCFGGSHSLSRASSQNR
jgi:putative acetyltransferase